MEATLGGGGIRNIIRFVWLVIYIWLEWHGWIYIYIYMPWLVRNFVEETYKQESDLSRCFSLAVTLINWPRIDDVKWVSHLCFDRSKVKMEKVLLEYFVSSLFNREKDGYIKWCLQLLWLI